MNLSSYSIDNIFVSDNVVKYQINSKGITLHNNAYYDIFTIPYVRYGLHFVLNDNKLMIDDISDETMQDIIIPNNSYYKQDDNHRDLSLKPINNVSLKLNPNVRYLYVNDNIENLTLTSDTVLNVISIPNKNFNLISNITVNYLIIRDYNNEPFNNIIDTFKPTTIINETNNSTSLLFNKKINDTKYKFDLITSLNNKIYQDHYYLYLMNENMKPMERNIYPKYFEQIDLEKDIQPIISNIDLTASFDNLTKRIYFKKDDNEFSIMMNEDATCYKLLLYDNIVFMIYNNDITKTDNDYYNFFTTTNAIDFHDQHSKLIEIDGKVYHYYQDNDKIFFNTIDDTETFNIPFDKNDILLEVIRCCSTILIFYITKNETPVINETTNEYTLKVLSTTNKINYYNNIITRDYHDNFVSSFQNNELIIQYQNIINTYEQQIPENPNDEIINIITNTTKKTITLRTYAFTITELLMKL